VALERREEEIREQSGNAVQPSSEASA
jgi:hypothetical protein